MTASGYVKAERKRFDHHLFRSEKWCRGYVWDWLVANAAFRQIKIDVQGRTVTLERGQLCHSIRYLAGVFGWDKAAVSRFLKRLESETMIKTSTETGQTLITICNYDAYQGADRSDRDTNRDGDRDSDETGARQERDSTQTKYKTLEEGEEVKKDDDEDAGASEPEVLTRREAILDLLGLDSSGLTGRGGRRLGTAEDMRIAAKWTDDLGLTYAEQDQVIVDMMARKREPGPPNTLSYFNPGMKRLAGEKAAPPLQPDNSTSGGRYGRTEQKRREGDAIDQWIEGRATGAIDLGPDPSNPFPDEH